MELGMYRDTKESGMENRIKKLSVMLTILMGFTSYAIADTVEDYKKSCIEGDAKGCYNLGLAHYEGKGVERNDRKSREYYGKAKEYYAKACDLSDATGCFNLGVMYEEGMRGEGDFCRTYSSLRE